MGLAYIFISHDLGVVRHIADRVAVMYLGRIVETGTAEEVFARPSHPYTRALLSAIPAPSPLMRRERRLMQGDLPSPIDPPPGCHLHTRCPFMRDRCIAEEPRLGEGSRAVACHFWRELPAPAGIVPEEAPVDPRLKRLFAAFVPSDNEEKARAAVVGADHIGGDHGREAAAHG